jgi:hypothetical protein
MKLKLNLDELANDFFEDALLLGIVAPMKDYQLCWHLNQQLRFNFRLNNEIEIQLSKKGRQYFFAVYEYKEPNGSNCHYLYNNQFDGEYLLPEFKHLDFLWMIKGDDQARIYLSEFSNLLRSINGVQLVTEVNADKIRNKAHLIF